MKTVTINFTAQTNVVSDYDLGRIGEHNATELVITPPTSLSGDSRTALYRVQFRTGSEIVTSESYTEVPFTVALWQQLTEHSRLSLQIVAYDADGEYIGKSEKLSGFYFDASVSGTPAIVNPNAQDLESEVTQNTLARHTHANKATLDDIPAPTAGDTGKALTVGENGLEWEENTAESSYEIARSGSPYTSNYTPAELSQFYNDGYLITYGKVPIIWASYENGEFHFGFVSTTRNGDVIHYRSDCYVSANKSITLSTEQTAVRTVNSKSAGNASGSLTLHAADIKATASWSPSSDTDLATKKYVDDNTGGSPDWSDIQNKPNFATVATSGDYDDLINKPTIPAAQIQADWNEADNTALDYIKNKPATMPPTAHTHTKSDITDFPSLATVATSGSYNDLLNQPTIPDISGCEVTTNKVTSLSNLSTDTEYPSAKCVYDELTAKQNTLTAGTGISIVGDTISATGGALPVGTANGDMLFWNGLAWVAHNPEVPLGYTPVEYIEGTGTQYIKTKIYISGESEIIIDASATSWTGSGNGVFGCRVANGDRMFELLALSGGLRADYSINSYYSFTVSAGRHKISLNSGATYVDGTLLNTETKSFDFITYEPYIFSSNQSGTPNAPFAMKLYKAEIYRSATLVARLIPCVRDSDSVAGVWDTVRQEFLTNAGTGTFTKGADV